MSVTIHDNVFDMALAYGEDEGSRLMWALIDYAQRGVEPDHSERWYPSFVGFAPLIAKSAADSRNGAKGGRPRKDQVDEVENPSGEGFANGLKTPSENPLEKPVSETSGKGVSKQIEINRKEKKGIEGKGEKRFIPPTTEDVEAYCEEWGHTIDAGAFVDFYTSKGWKVGSAPMKDWKAAVRNWWRTDHKRGQDPLNDKPGKYDKYKKFGV